jgi:hypothetical protein
VPSSQCGWEARAGAGAPRPQPSCVEAVRLCADETCAGCQSPERHLFSWLTLPLQPQARGREVELPGATLAATEAQVSPIYASDRTGSESCDPVGVLIVVVLPVFVQDVAHGVASQRPLVVQLAAVAHADDRLLARCPGPAAGHRSRRSQFEGKVSGVSIVFRERRLRDAVAERSVTTTPDRVDSGGRH